MNARNRRQFFSDVGKGMLIAGLGTGLVSDMGCGAILAAEEPAPLNFGPLDALATLMQETPVEKLLPALVAQIKSGVDLKQLVSAGALANARTFGGEDYIGFHTMMALTPALAMAGEMPEARRPLPVLKVLYRNTNRIQEHGGRASEVLRAVEAASLPADQLDGDHLRDAARRMDMNGAEGLFAALAHNGADSAFNELLHMVHDACEVHRTVLPYRAWTLVGLLGEEHAHTLLRQSVRFCVKNEPAYSKNFGQVREVIPRVVDQHKLLGLTPGDRQADDAWVEQMAATLFTSTAEQAADAAAAALAEGLAPDCLAEAISLAANQLILRDAGRPADQTSPNKPVGSVHGDSIGVHACDSANAWRNMARLANNRNKMVSLVLSAYQVALDRVQRGGDFLNWQAWPHADVLSLVTVTEPEALLREADAAIRGNDQAHAAAAVHRYGALGYDARNVFDLLLGYSTSEDGALHAEKFYRTASDEFEHTRPAFRWRQLVGLARVVASSCGQPAPGYAEACGLLGV